MNSCMRQTGTMNPMRNNNTSGMDCPNMDHNTMNNMEMNDIDNFPIAMAYVPWQKWRDVVDGHKGLEQGTIFNELTLSFLCANKCCGNSSQVPNKLPYGRETQKMTNGCGCDRKW